MQTVNLEKQLDMKEILKAIFGLIRSINDDKTLISKEMYEILGDEESRKKLIAFFNEHKEIEEFCLNNKSFRVKIADGADEVLSTK